MSLQQARPPIPTIPAHEPKSNPTATAGGEGERERQASEVVPPFTREGEGREREEGGAGGLLCAGVTYTKTTMLPPCASQTDWEEMAPTWPCTNGMAKTEAIITPVKKSPDTRQPLCV